MKRFALFLATILCAAPVLAQPDALWSQAYGGTGGDVGNSVEETSDGGYIMIGYIYTGPANGYDFWLLKTDASGDTLWTKTFGGTNSDVGLSGRETSDGGYILTGYTSSIGAGSYDIWLIKTDSLGNEDWSKTFGGTGSDDGRSVRETSDGGYIIVGFTSSYGAGAYDIWLVKTNAFGTEQWNKTFGGATNDFGYSVEETSDGGYIIAGRTDSYGAGGTDFWLIKTDAVGNGEWTQTFGGTDGEVSYSVQQTSDGGYIIAGHTMSFGAGDWDFWLVKTNAIGNEEWSQTFGGISHDVGLSGRETSDGGYIMTGYTMSFGPGSHGAWLVKVGPEEPLILSVSDVPYDQGGQVTIEWSASSLDNDENPLPFYSIWRALPEVPLNMNSSLSIKDIRMDFQETAYRFETIESVDFAWEWIANQPAHNFSTYAYSAETLYDSSSGSNGINTFLVSAHMSDDPSVFYDSNVDSGYSVDNLAPAVPTGLFAVAGEGTTIELAWDSPIDEDFDYFGLYRSVESGFDPAGMEPYAMTIDTSFLDIEIGIGQMYYYRLSSVDFNGNESEYSEVVDAMVLSTANELVIPTEFVLRQNFPNPFNPITTLRYDLPENNFVNITIYNMLGRHVKTLVNQTQDAGYRSVIWNATNDNGKPVSAGVYLYQIQAGEFVQTKKMVLLK